MEREVSEEIKTAIGLMSGTSMDGIDVALLKTDGRSIVEMGPSAAFDYTLDQRKALEAGMQDAEVMRERHKRPGSLFDLERAVTNWHCEAVEQFLASNQMTSDDIDIVGFHGQTVLHRPQDGYTVQIGHGDEMAKRLGIDVVYDLRANDMKAGGQGAPLVPVYHQALALSLETELPAVFVNIGGISNVSYIGRDTELIAFDSGPGNALIDQWMLSEAGIPYDQGGRIASEGVVSQSIVDRYVTTPYFSAKVPKSLDRFDFPPLETGSLDVADGARTLAHISAASIFKATDHFPEKPAVWVISGGGRLNVTMMNELRDMIEAAGQQMMFAEDLNLNGDMMEAEAFAYLAVRSLYELPLTFPGTTGCEKPSIGGVVARKNQVLK